jgi:hypothetical protein
MSETVLAALIAASATILTTLLQLKISLSRDSSSAARTSNGSSRRKNKMPVLLLVVMLTAAAVGGFALSQWFADRERIQQKELRTELQARITEISRTAGELKQTRLDTRAEVETDVLRRMGGQGVMALATISPCRVLQAAPVAPAPLPAVATTTSDSSAVPITSTTAAPASAPVTAQTSAPSGCSEAEAVHITLCASIPSNAVVSHVDLFTRFADSEASWKASHVAAGEEVDQARFSEQATESLADDGMKHVCHTFANWSTQRSRIARMIVRYAIAADEALEPQTQVRQEGLPATAGALAVR